MSLVPMNRMPQFMAGSYRRMFELPVLSVNRDFVTHPYLAGSCPSSEPVCFSLIDGALPCHRSQNYMTVWTTDGRVRIVPAYL
jgi:hypothetical protein